MDQDQVRDQHQDQHQSHDKNQNLGKKRENYEGKDQEHGEDKHEGRTWDQGKDQRQDTGMTITDRKKSLEEKTSSPVAKSIKVEYASTFSIKPLIDFFNRAFRRDTSCNESNHKETRSMEEHVEANEANESDAGDLSDSLSDSGTFVSCCSRFDLSDTVSLYYSFDEMSSNDTDDDHSELEMDYEEQDKKQTEIKDDSVSFTGHVDGFEQKYEGLLENYGQLKSHQQRGFIEDYFEKSNSKKDILSTQDINEDDDKVFNMNLKFEKKSENKDSCKDEYFNIEDMNENYDVGIHESFEVLAKDCSSHIYNETSSIWSENGSPQCDNNIKIETCHSEKEDCNNESQIFMNNEIIVAEKTISCQDEHEVHTENTLEKLPFSEAILYEERCIFEQNSNNDKETQMILSERRNATETEEKANLRNRTDLKSKMLMFHQQTKDKNTISNDHGKFDEVSGTYPEITNNNNTYNYEVVKIFSNNENKVIANHNDSNIDTISKEYETNADLHYIPASDNESNTINFITTYSKELAVHVKEETQHSACNINLAEVPLQVQQEIKLEDHLINAKGTNDKDFNKGHCPENNSAGQVDIKSEDSIQIIQSNNFVENKNFMTHFDDAEDHNKNLLENDSSVENDNDISNAESTNKVAIANSEDDDCDNSDQKICKHHTEIIPGAQIHRMTERISSLESTFYDNRLDFTSVTAEEEISVAESVDEKYSFITYPPVCTADLTDITEFEHNTKVVDKSVAPDYLVKVSDFQVHQVSKSSSTGHEMAGTHDAHKEYENNLKRDPSVGLKEKENQEEVKASETVKDPLLNDMDNGADGYSGNDDSKTTTLYPYKSKQISGEGKYLISKSDKRMDQQVDNEIATQKYQHPHNDSTIEPTIKKNFELETCDVIEDNEDFYISKNQEIPVGCENQRTTLPDLVKSTSQRKENNKKNNAEEIYFLDAEKVNLEHTQNKKSESDKHNNMSISGDDKYMNDVLESVLDTKEVENHNDLVDEMKESLGCRHNDKINSRQIAANKIEMKEFKDEKKSEQTREACSPNSFPDIVKDQFLEGTSPFDSDDQEYLRLDNKINNDNNPSNIHSLFHQFDDDSRTIFLGDSINNNSISLNETKDMVQIQILADAEKPDASHFKSLIDYPAIECTAKLETEEEDNLKSKSNDKSCESKSWRDCNSVCSTSSSLPDSEPTLRRKYSRRSVTEEACNKKPWNYGSCRNLRSTSSSSVMKQSIDSDVFRDISEQITQSEKDADENKFDKKPWNFAAGNRKASITSYTNLFSKSEDHIHGGYSEKRKSSETRRSPSVTEFNKKPWNYGAWRDRRSLSTFTHFAWSSQSEEIFPKRRRKSQVVRRATISDLGRKPWNYGGGGSKYKKLCDFFDRKRSVL